MKPRTGVLVAIVLAILAPAARAEHGERAGRAPALALYAQECGACHAAFPAGMLPRPSWARIMGQLERHYGTDATLDATTARTIAAWLDANGGTSRRAAEEPPEDRITRAAWYQRKLRKVPAQTWKSPAVKSAANCAACHRGAPEGGFDEHDVRIPR
jgi:hypothetical protein